MPRRLRNGISNSARREMAKTISRFAMSEHADLTFGTKESCLDGTQTTRKLGGGRAEPQQRDRGHSCVGVVQQRMAGRAAPSSRSRHQPRVTHAHFTDFIVHFRMDWRSVCRGIDNSCWTVCGGI
jgi:hypothetical protein